MTDFTRTSPPLTFDDIKKLKHGDVICIPRPKKLGNPTRWRVNGKLRTYVRTPDRFELPVKHGLYNYAKITDANLDTWNALHAYIETSGDSA